MGIELVNLLLVGYAPTLSGRAFKVLCRMAVMALDKPNEKGQAARLYFGGDAPLLAVLYGTRDQYTPAQVRELRTVLRELVKSGLISSTNEGKRPRRDRQCYRLNLTVTVAADRGQSPLNIGGDSPDPSTRIGGKSSSDRGKIPTPRRRQEQEGQDSLEESHPSAGASSPDRAPQSTADGLQGHVDWSQPHQFEPDDYGLDCRCNLRREHERHNLWSRRSA